MKIVNSFICFVCFCFFLLVSSLSAQPGFYRADTEPTYLWGRQDIDKIVSNYVSAAGEPTISSNVQLAFTSNLVSANDRYWFWKDSAGTNIGVLGMNGDNNIVIGTTSTPAGVNKGDVLFYVRNSYIMTIQTSGLYPSTANSIFLGNALKPFAALHASETYLHGNTISEGGVLTLYNATDTGSITLLASDILTTPSAYKLRFPKTGPTSVGQTLVYTALGGLGVEDYRLDWGSGGISYPLNHTGSGSIIHSLATEGPDVTLTLTAYSSSSSEDRGGMTHRRARGTVASPSAVSVGDRLGVWAGFGYVGSDFSSAASIEFRARAVSSPNVAGSIEFLTRNTGGTLAARWRLYESGDLGPLTDAAYNFGSSTLRPQSSYFRTVDLANDRYVFGRDTAGTAIGMFGMNGDNNVVFGTTSTPSGSLKGNVLFYVRNSYVMTVQSSGLYPSNTNSIFLGSSTLPFAGAYSNALVLRGDAITEGGSLLIQNAVNTGGVYLLSSTDLSSPGYYNIRLPKDSPTSTGQVLQVSSASYPNYQLAWSTSGVGYPLNHTGTDGPSPASDVTHSLATNSQNVTLTLATHSSDAQSDRAGITLRRTRGTSTSRLSVVAGDRLGVIGGVGYANSDYRNAALIQFYADSVSDIDSFVSGRVEFFTTNGTGSLASRWTLNASGHWVPSAGSTYDVGTSGVPVRAVYTNNLSAAGSVLTSLVPSGSGTYALGGPFNYWAQGYFTGLSVAGSATFTGAITVASCTGCGGGGGGDVTTTTAQIISGQKTFTSTNNYFNNILSNFAGTYNLGASGNRWATGYFGTVDATTASITNANVTNLSASTQVSGPLGVFTNATITSLSFNYSTGSLNIGNVISGNVTVNTAGGTGLSNTYCASTSVKSITVSAGIVVGVTCN